MKNSERRVLIVKDKSRLELLTEQFSTKSQAKFYIKNNRMNFAAKLSKKKASKRMPPSMQSSFFGSKKIRKRPTQQIQQQMQQQLDQVQEIQQEEMLDAEVENFKNEGEFGKIEEEDTTFQETITYVQQEVRKQAKPQIVERDYLSSFLFAKDDIIVVVGRDGLVANTAKYAKNLPIIGINPDPDKINGIFLPYHASQIGAVLTTVLNNNFRSRSVTMAEVEMNDGQRLLAFNDIFIGTSTHRSAHYRITHNQCTEKHSSSGIIISTGAGSTGWLSSIANMTNKISEFCLGNQSIKINQAQNNPFNIRWDTDYLLFVVREAFESKNSQTTISIGKVTHQNSLMIESLMSEEGVIFSDGILDDYIRFNSGAIAYIGIAEEKANLVS